jgi:hypothetical protein
MEPQQEWYAISEPAGVTFPPCAQCGAWALEIRCIEDPDLESVSTGFVVAAACKACGAGWEDLGGDAR